MKKAENIQELAEKLTPKQHAFAEAYIALGNATQAAIEAQYSRRTASRIGPENLKKPAVAAYIRARMRELDEKRVAKANEVMEFYTRVMRGEEKDQFGLDATLADRIKAGAELMKRYAVGEEESVTAKLDAIIEGLDNAAKQ